MKNKKHILNIFLIVVILALFWKVNSAYSNYYTSFTDRVHDSTNNAKEKEQSLQNLEKLQNNVTSFGDKLDKLNIWIDSDVQFNFGDD